MESRQLGKTELRVSAIGLGCQSLGGGLYHRDDDESTRTIHQAIDAGISIAPGKIFSPGALAYKNLASAFIAPEALASLLVTWIRSP